MLADIVQKHRDRVLAFARHRLAQLIPERSAREAENYLPILLDHIVNDLDDPQVKADNDNDVAVSAADHGRERQRLGADIQFVVHDFGVICEAISEIVRRAGIPIDAAEWQKLNRALDLGIAHAISAFEGLRLDRERRDSAAEFGSLAHELRNALAAASVAFEAVRRGRVGTQSRTADIVTRNLKQASLLAANLVVGSKVDARPELALASLALRPIVEDVVASVPPAGNVISEIEVATETVVVADKQLLMSALTNLVQNALKFTRPDGRVTVRAFASEEAVAIEVEDECGGLPAGAVESVFTPFVQQSADRSGAGLGLSIVRKIMLAHGGSVRVRDQPGRGCIFELSFPRRAPL